MDIKKFEGMEIKAGVPSIRARGMGTGHHLVGVQDAEVMLGQASGQHLERRFSDISRSQRNSYMAGIRKVSLKNNGCLKVISRTKRTDEQCSSDKRDVVFVVMFKIDFDAQRERLRR